MNLKRLLPSAVKDCAKSFVNRAIGPLEACPKTSVVAEGDWFSSPVDGVISRHRPPSLDDPKFHKVIQHLDQHGAFGDLGSAERGETVLFRLYLAGQLARLTKNIEGDWVKFGTYRGATAYCMLDAAEECHKRKKRESSFTTLFAEPQSGTLQIWGKR